jgi:glycosyltransferase involved in cell wall biosynthesis
MFFMLAAARRVGRLVAQGEVDVIHVHNQFSGFLITVLNSFFWKKPLIVTTHNQEIFEDSFKKYIKSLPERYILHKADKVVCVSPTVRELLISKVNVAPSSLVQIYSGVELGASANSAARQQEGCKVITVARIVPRKNQMLVIEAAREVVNRLPDARFSFIGPPDDVSYFNLLKERVAALHLTEHVCFTGEVSDAELDAAYADADLFVLTSTNENQGLVILEAMARSVPVICSSIGPFKDMVSAQVGSAVMIEDRDDLVEAILALSNDPKRAHAQTLLATQVVERLGWGNAAREYEALFTELLSNRQPAQRTDIPAQHIEIINRN